MHPVDQPEEVRGSCVMLECRNPLRCDDYGQAEEVSQLMQDTEC